MATTQHRHEAVRMAKSQEAAVVEKCKRSGVAAPGYVFDELIGKGSFGRVYKGRHTSTQKVVAVKVIDIDDADFRAFGDRKDEQINDFNKEIRILRQAQESGAPNLNRMIEALPVHSQLWLVCEYCPGGSVKTLMRATNDRLGEPYIIVVARELSKALKGLHDAGIMHRDVKAANVLIHEEGRLQLCDFGVATVLDKKSDKRRTFIGTPHWMPPELWDRDPEYSDEVDVWAFGCTLYECAVGKPPNADLREPQQLRSRMRRLNQSIELPEIGTYSPGLRSLVSYTLTPDAARRPSFSEVLSHEHLSNTDESHPTTILSELVKVYYSWLYGGGQRASLFMPGGATAGDKPGTLPGSDEEWNFSATNNFENRMSAVLDTPQFANFSDTQRPERSPTPNAREVVRRELSREDAANFEERVRRGADLSNIFDENKPSYEYVTKTDFIPIQQRRVSDLPLRAMSEERPYSIANQVIDLGDFDSSNYAAVAQAKEEKIKLADAATIKANRGNSKVFLEVSSSETLTARPPLSVNGSTVLNDKLSSATQDFAFPPKEWNRQDSLEEEAHVSKTAKARHSAKHKTMEWSFASAMSEAQDDRAQVSPIPEEAESKQTKHGTMQWSFQSAMAEASGTAGTFYRTPSRRTGRQVPAPLLRSVTEPVGTDMSRTPTYPSEPDPLGARDEVDPFALDDNAGYKYPIPMQQEIFGDRGSSSFYGRGREGVFRAATVSLGGRTLLEERRDDGEGYEQLREDEDDHHDDFNGEGDDDDDKTLVITMPAVHAIDVRVLDADAPPAGLETELDRLLGDFQGVLAGASIAVEKLATSATRRRRNTTNRSSENVNGKGKRSLGLETTGSRARAGSGRTKGGEGGGRLLENERGGFPGGEAEPKTESESEPEPESSEWEDEEDEDNDDDDDDEETEEEDEEAEEEEEDTDNDRDYGSDEYATHYVDVDRTGNGNSDGDDDMDGHKLGRVRGRGHGQVDLDLGLDLDLAVGAQETGFH